MTISKVKLPPTGGSKVTLKHLGWEIFALMLKKPYTHNMMGWLKACRCLSWGGIFQLRRVCIEYIPGHVFLLG